MRKEIKAVICVVLAFWLFFIGFEVGSIREKKVLTAQLQESAAKVTTTEAQTTTAPLSTMPQTTQPVSSNEALPSDTSDVTAPSNDTAVTTNASADPASMTTQEILKNVSSAFETLRSEKNMKADKTETVTIQLTELSVPGAKSIINSIIQRLAGEETASYTFTNGVGSGTDDGKEVSGLSVAEVVPPRDGFKLPEAGVSSASAKKEGDSTTYTIKLVEENTTYTSPVPQYNSVAYSYLDLTTVDISGATITDANMHYPGTTITLTVNGDGKITNLHFNMPMDGNGAAKITFMNGSASFEGSDDEVWTFTY